MKSQKHVRSDTEHTPDAHHQPLRSGALQALLSCRIHTWTSGMGRPHGKTGGIARPLSRVLAYALILSLCLPLPLPGQAAPQDSDAGAAHVLARLNGPERAKAVEEAGIKDAAMRAAAAAEPSTLFRTDGSGPPPADMAKPDQTPHQPTATPPLHGGASPPKSFARILAEQAAAFMGLPVSMDDPARMNQPQDEGLGFHQDGTVRKAARDGTATGVDGRRAVSYALHGTGNGLGIGNAAVPGYDPSANRFIRPSDPLSDGGVHRGWSMDMDGLDPHGMALQRALGHGLGFANSFAEAGLSQLTDGGRARLNFTVDADGRPNGEGDLLFPLHDSPLTTVFTQAGARSMSGLASGTSAGRGADRWIGNLGLGQRWFPQATDMQDSGNWMLGYNAFFDYDFTRAHQRGGIGAEVQYDWLHLASNYYYPLSSWRDSKDFDGDFIQERPAEGWDLRARGYLPFYRNVALTGGYSQWHGDHVGMFSTSDLEKDPRVWSYGIEYTPVPLVSGFITQRSTERGRSDTEFGLRFTYHFQMPWEDQISHNKVAELRTVSGSRHEFVDRENRIILEYKAKQSHRIEYLGPDGSNGFLFRVRDGFGKYAAGQTVLVTASGPYLAQAQPVPDRTLLARALDVLGELVSVRTAHAVALLSKTYITDAQGQFRVRLDPSAPASTFLTIASGNVSQTFAVAVSGGSPAEYIAIDSFTNGGPFTAQRISTASVTVAVKNADGSDVADGTTVTWSVTGAQNNSQAMASGWGTRSTGLTWGTSAPTALEDMVIADLVATATSNTSGGKATIQLTDIVGERNVTIRATVHLDGEDRTVSQAVSYPDGPLAVFRAPAPGHAVYGAWTLAYSHCNGAAYPGDPGTWTAGGYVGGGKLPTAAELHAVMPATSGWGSNPDPTGKGAALAAGWDHGYYYATGEAHSSGYIYGVLSNSGGTDSLNIYSDLVRAACRR
ncbi:inverse autotransporter beta domain-containing protein [Nitratidesulfovibrio sp. D1]|uniref:inverse autotransporter beta domain-containing protein n=1 Tax=Nitratidesulfovibrio sp. D1 TaxID=3440151 RepID=UPI003EBB3D0A